MEDKEEKVDLTHMTLKQALNNKNFDKEFESVVINDDVPVTFTDEDYKIEEGEFKYINTSENDKIETATAIISKNTLAIYTSTNIKYPEPENWSDKIDTAGIYNRSHRLAYSLIARNVNSEGVFIGTKHLNQITMKSVEKDIYKSVSENKRMYLYKVTAYYYKEDAVPYGILIEAESIDKLDKKTYCRFCYNIQDGYKINYYDGGFEPIEKVYGTREEVVKNTRNTNKTKNKYREYAINIRTKMFHLDDQERCSCLRKVPLKYIQETNADKNEVISKTYIDKNGNEKCFFHLCKKCIKD